LNEPARASASEVRGFSEAQGQAADPKAGGARYWLLTRAQSPGDLRQGLPLPLQRLYSVQLFRVLLAIAGRPPSEQRRQQQSFCDAITGGAGWHTRHLGQFDQSERRVAQTCRSLACLRVPIGTGAYVPTKVVGTYAPPPKLSEPRPLRSSSVTREAPL